MKETSKIEEINEMVVWQHNNGFGVADSYERKGLWSFVSPEELGKFIADWAESKNNGLNKSKA